MIIGNKEFDTRRHTYIMGILNVTPDSFSDGGNWMEVDAALKHVECMLEEGMDILDIGGESNRPGHQKISGEEEIARVIPVIRAVKKRFGIPISLDTSKSEVAEAGILAGADMINDIWGLKYDGRMADVIARNGVPCCLTYQREKIVTENFMMDVTMGLTESVQFAREAGIADENIMIDPGVGFGKTYEQNLEVINHLQELNSFGYPLLLGCSRKSVIGEALGLPENEREEGTLVTTVMGVMKGCSFVRVHDVEKNVRAVKMAEAILGRGKK